MTIFDSIQNFPDYQRVQQDFLTRQAMAAQQMQNMGTENQAAQFGLQQQKTSAALQMLSAAPDEATYQAAKPQVAQRFGVDLSVLPPDLMTAKNQTMTAQERLNANLKLAEINTNNPQIYANQKPPTLNDMMGGSGESSPQPNSNSPASTANGTSPSNASGYIPAITQVESGGNPNAVSPAGARGEMQIMPSTAAQPGFGVTPSNGTPEDDQRVAKDYINAMFARYPNRPDLALQAYNGGPGRVDQVANGNMSPSQLPQETQQYPGKVFAAMGQTPSATNAPSATTALPAAYHTKLSPEGQAIIDNLAPGLRATAIAEIDGQRPPPPPGSLMRQGPQSKIANAVDQAVREADPTFKDDRFSTLQSFDKGADSNSVKTFNVVAQHVELLRGLAAALGNGDTQAINAISNKFQTIFGQPAPTTFDGVKQIVSDEITKGVIGNSGAVSDREGTAKTLASYNSPQQIVGLLDNGIIPAIKGQFEGLQQKYLTGTGRADFQDRLLPAAKALFTGYAANQGNSTIAPNNSPVLKTASGKTYQVLK